MKRIIVLIMLMIISLTSCQKQETSSKKTYKIEILKQLDHASLNEIANSIEDQLNLLAKQKDVEIVINVDSGQNDPTVLKQIVDQAIANEVDAIIPIATLAAQISVNGAANSKTPVIFAAISNPIEADLTGYDYVSGTSDGIDTSFIYNMMSLQNPNLKTVGLLYSLSEINSKKPIDEMKELLTKNNISFIEAVGNNNDEIISAASVLISEKVDAIFTPTDNVVMATELAIAPSFIEAGIPHYTGADSFVRNGAYATCGVNYKELGIKTADITFDVLENGFSNIEDYYLMSNDIVTVNIETANELNLDYKKLSSIASTIVETTTSED